MLIERQFDTGAVVINYAECEGARPPLVLLHGVTLWWKYFLPVLPRLSARWHTYALDLRGHGGSAHMAGRYRMADFAEDTVAFLQQRVGEPAILVGHSLGGWVALQVAAQHPELVGAVVVEDSPLVDIHRGPRPRAQYELFRALAAADSPHRVVVDRLASLWPERDEPRLRMRAHAIQALDPEVLTMTFDGRMTEHFDVLTTLAQVSCPVLLLLAYPAEGNAAKEQAELAAREVARDLCVVRFPGVGHTIQADQPDWYARVVSDFLESLPASPGRFLA